MKHLYTEIVIDQPLKNVWQALTDFEKYPQWNSFLTKVDGELRVGSRLKVCATPPRSVSRVFYPVILSVNEGHEFRWLGQLFLPGILDGEHIFTLKVLDKNKTLFIHREEFSGLIVPLHQRVRLAGTRKGFIAMNEDLSILRTTSPLHKAGETHAVDV